MIPAVARSATQTLSSRCSTGHGDQPLGWRVSGFATLLVLLQLAALSPLGWTQPTSQPIAAHPPILIDGDADLCNAADLDGGVDVADGIVNCAIADGSPDRPYVIQGWNVTWEPPGPCRLQPTPGLCPPLPPCSTSNVPAAIAICGTRKHIRLESSEISNAEVVRDVEAGIPAAALLLSNADHVNVKNLDLRAGGIALFVEAGKEIPTLNPLSEGVTVVDVRARSWVESAESAAGTALPALNVARLSIVRILDMPVALRGVTLDARLRDIAVDASSVVGSTRFELVDSLVANGSSTAGVRLFKVDSVVERNVFRDIGIQLEASVAANVIAVQDGSVMIRQNRFELRSDGIQLGGTPVGHIRENVFVPSSSNVEVRALKQDVNGCASVRFSYNDVPGVSLFNDDNTCPLDARYNWWDGEARTETSATNGGSIATDPPLSRPLAELPVVVVAGPAQGTQVYGKVFLFGGTETATGFAVDRIEASALESEWVFNRSAPSAGEWQLVWDVGGEVLGPLSLFVRACAVGDDCGLPTRVDLFVIERPLPPIAFLEATPRVAAVGEPVRLDASLSYSPQGRPLLSYRFDLGTGDHTPWQSEPVFQATFETGGQYPTSVQVRDALNLVSENLPQSVIRIQDLNEAAGATTPGATVVGLLAGLVLLVGLSRRRA